jgi:hypothetical protein
MSWDNSPRGPTTPTPPFSPRCPFQPTHVVNARDCWQL